MELEKLRITHNLTQVEVAEKLGLAKMTYHNYETGRNEPNIKTLIKIADFYNITIDYLVGREFANDYGCLSIEEQELLKNFRNMNNQSKIMLLGEAKAFSLMK